MDMDSLSDATMEKFQQIQGADVYSSDDEKIGKVEELFTDIDTGKPEWIGVGTGIFRTKRVLVPVQGATWTGDAMRVPFTKQQIQDSPDIDGSEIGQETEDVLARHYGMGYSEQRSDTGLPEMQTSQGTSAGTESVTRSEEELAVGTRKTEAGTVRLRKWVETEPVQETVQVSRDVAEVRREPIGDTAAAGDIGEQEIEVTLEKEEPVVDKRTVAKERVSLDKSTQTDAQTISDEVRKERVEIEGDDVVDVQGDKVEEQR